jgi:hypothetical protein
MPDWERSLRDERLKALGFAGAARGGYERYLGSPTWGDARARYAASGKPTSCFVCADERDVEYHHRTYERLGVEHPDDLVPLCRRHHDRVGKYVLNRWAWPVEAHASVRAIYVQAVLERHSRAIRARTQAALNEPGRFVPLQGALDVQVAAGRQKGELGVARFDAHRHAAQGLLLTLELAGLPGTAVAVLATFPYGPGTGSKWMRLEEYIGPLPAQLTSPSGDPPPWHPSWSPPAPRPDLYLEWEVRDLEALCPPDDYAPLPNGPDQLPF